MKPQDVLSRKPKEWGERLEVMRLRERPCCSWMNKFKLGFSRGPSARYRYVRECVTGAQDTAQVTASPPGFARGIPWQSGSHSDPVPVRTPPKASLLL